MILNRWVGERYYTAWCLGSRAGLEWTDYHGGEGKQEFERIEALVEEMHKVTPEPWWSGHAATLFSQKEAEFFMQTESIRTKIFGEVRDYSGHLPFRYLQAEPVGEGQQSFFD
jgi:hypothetical protein